MFRWSSYPNRTICQVLEEIRQLDKTKNYGCLLGLIEEVQSLANRMEAGLQDQKDFNEMKRHKVRLKKEIKELENKK